MQIVQAVNAGRCFFGHALDRGALCGEPTGAGGKAFSDLVEQAHLFIAGRHGDQIGFARLDPRAHQDVQRGVAAIVQDHVAGADTRLVRAAELKDAVGVVPVIL